MSSQVTIKNDLISVLEKEMQALLAAAQQLPDEGVSLVQEILRVRGRVVFSGMGKSGHIGRKLVATFSSMGTPSIFLHPSEALHGDLGMVRPDDLFIALSKSGTGTELTQVIDALRAQGNKTALICCRRGALSFLVDLSVCLPFDREACELNLAPTSSSTLMIAFGDAVAVAVSKAKGFEKNDFARAHPAGALGKQLLSTVQSFMYGKNELPLVQKESSFQDVIVKATAKKLGLVIVVDSLDNFDNIDGCEKLLGIITDGDLRRACKLGPELFEKRAHEIMTHNPKTVAAGVKAYAALEIMEEFNITSLVVTDKDRVVGIVHLHDLVKAGITGIKG
ncbi:KpsF/GutQ family sugar-phosphate isomerase [Candidatus Dependentiae bacterium]|nr:KpsF/GutQ family sugar-phosphate isomerase [Candidatus Dependentiae bacterium]